MKERFFKIADIILIIVIILAVVLWGTIRNTQAPCKAIIYVDGKEYMQIDLEKRDSQVIEVNNVYIYVHAGYVEINGSDCPDGLCGNFSPISKPGTTIACVPNRVVIAIVANNDYIDGVTG